MIEYPQIHSSTLATHYYDGSSDGTMFDGNFRRVQWTLNNVLPDLEGPGLFKPVDDVNEEAYEEEIMPSLRMVRVIVADPDENLNIEHRILIDTGEKLTDLTDQELFLELDIKPTLDAHNTLRAETTDKKKSAEKDRDIFLDKIKIRDLKMTVITIAEFA